MASTALNLPPLSSSSRSFSLSNSDCHVSATSLAFQIPKKSTQISCLARKSTVSTHPIKRNKFSYGFFSPQYIAENAEAAERDVMVAKAAEVAAPNSEETASLPSKSLKKAKAAKYPRRFVDLYQVLRNPVITEASIKNIAEENSLLFTVDVRADKKMIKDAVKNLFGVSVRKVNTSIRPDGTKKAFIMLSKEYNASDIAKSIGVFPGSD